jgi:hypothetical protein
MLIAQQSPPLNSDRKLQMKKFIACFRQSISFLNTYTGSIVLVYKEIIEGFARVLFLRTLESILKP